jgi:hypothetical protein
MKNNKLTLTAATLVIAFSLLSCSGDSSSDSSSEQGIVYVDNSNTSGVENISIIGLDFRGGEQNVVYAGGAKKLTIKHCIISGADPAPVWNRTSGILIYSFGDGDKSSDITITDNTLYNNHTGGINVSVFGNARYGFESTKAIWTIRRG